MRIRELQEQSLAQFIGQKIKTAVGNQPATVLNQVGTAAQTTWNDILARTSRSQALRGQNTEIPNDAYSQLLQSFVETNMLRQRIENLPAEVRDKVDSTMDIIVANRNNASRVKSAFQELARLAMTPTKDRMDTTDVGAEINRAKQTLGDRALRKTGVAEVDRVLGLLGFKLQ
jgi:hypothetical protein